MLPAMPDSATSPRHFPPPWSVEDLNPKLERQCFIVRDANGQAMAYYEDGRWLAWRTSDDRTHH